jgi:hypothetical protein
MMTTPERFEDRLLRELRQVVAERPAPATGSPRRTRRTRLALGGVGIAAATIAIAVIATGSDVTPNAYAVESHANGAVTVSISALRDANGLQSSLRAAGVPAVVTYVSADGSGCPSAPPAVGAGTGPVLEQGSTSSTAPGAPSTTVSPAGAAAPPAGVTTTTATAVAKPVTIDGSGAATVTIAPGQIKPGEHVYITAAGASVGSVAVAISPGTPPGACVTTTTPAPAGDKTGGDTGQ